MKLTVTPRQKLRATALFYGDAFGMAALVSVEPGQKWHAERSSGYWYLRKKGTGIVLRLTDAAMNRLFVEVSEK